jgi:hypothetical protein
VPEAGKARLEEESVGSEAGVENAGNVALYGPIAAVSMEAARRKSSEVALLTKGHATPYVCEYDMVALLNSEFICIS